MLLHSSSAVTVSALLGINFVFGTGAQLVNVTVMLLSPALMAFSPLARLGRALPAS
jgi:hypothetical protein